MILAEYSPVMAEAVVNVPEYIDNKFMIIENRESEIRPIGIHKNFDKKMYNIIKLKYHKFWVIANKQKFRSAKSESDLANPDNIVGIGCFINEKHDSKCFIFNINDTLFYGPAIFPDGGQYVCLQSFNVISESNADDYIIIKKYLTDIKDVQYWDFNKYILCE